MSADIECWLVCVECGMGVVKIERIPAGNEGVMHHNVVQLAGTDRRKSPCGRDLKRKENLDAPNPCIVCAH